MIKKLKQLGPGIIIAAAFIGPGSVTTATIAGASYGYTLLWAVLFSIVASIVLQEMSARVGLVAKMGLGDALRVKTANSWLKYPVIFLVLGSILVGNAAYEAGNITGAVLGFPQFQNLQFNPLVFVVAILAFLLLFSGKYKLIERSLVTLVSIMGIVFFIAAISLQPNYAKIIHALFIPKLPQGAGLLVIGLIGTTVVPYNLFLHAASVQQKWSSVKDLSTSRLDTVLSISLGGLISMAILITAAVAFEGETVSISGFTDLSTQLKPLLGNWSTNFLAFGFLAAGVSSSITAPLAAAFATSEILGWKSTMKSTKFRLVWLSVLGLGVLFSSLGIKPTELILFAQAANGILLPIIAVFLLWIVNDNKLMGMYTNGVAINMVAILVILITFVLGIKSIVSVFSSLTHAA